MSPSLPLSTPPRHLRGTLAALPLLFGLVAGAAAQPASAPTGANEPGRELFQANCVRCHGPDARGTAMAPDLLVRVQGMSEERFVNAVLRRYAWTVPAGDAGSEDALRQAIVSGLRPPSGDEMPRWEASPSVRAGVRSLYRYLQSPAGTPAR